MQGGQIVRIRIHFFQMRKTEISYYFRRLGYTVSAKRE